MKLPRRNFLHLAAGAAALPAGMTPLWGTEVRAQSERADMSRASGACRSDKNRPCRTAFNFSMGAFKVGPPSYRCAEGLQWQVSSSTKPTSRSLAQAAPVWRPRGPRCRSARYRLGEELRTRRCGHHLRRWLSGRRIAIATAERYPGHTRPGLQGLDRMGRSVGRRGLGPLLHRAHAP